MATALEVRARPIKKSRPSPAARALRKLKEEVRYHRFRSKWEKTRALDHLWYRAMKPEKPVIPMLPGTPPELLMAPAQVAILKQAIERTAKYRKSRQVWLEVGSMLFGVWVETGARGYVNTDWRFIC